jgi:hypothetical protein
VSLRIEFDRNNDVLVILLAHYQVQRTQGHIFCESSLLLDLHIWRSDSTHIISDVFVENGKSRNQIYRSVVVQLGIFSCLWLIVRKGTVILLMHD